MKQPDSSISNQIIENLPFGIYLIDRDYQISYYNQAFADIFKPSVHQLTPYFGSLVNCQYCVDGSPDKQSVMCSNCLFTKQYKLAFDNRSATEPRDIVQEFEIQGVKTLKYLTIQSIYLNDELVLVIVKDSTQIAEKLLNQDN